MKSLRIGVAGLGSVGAALVGRLQVLKQDDAAFPLDVVAISARDKTRARPFDATHLQWFDNPIDLATNADIDVFVELMGGSEGVAHTSVKAALQRGVAVVTANKALLAAHGAELAALAEAKNVALAFEAAVAGGIPIIKALGESLALDDVSRIEGVLNGTCNYILTAMESTGAGFRDALADAQKLGYAEADPTLDINGMDAANKIVLLASLAFQTRPDMSRAQVSGIEAIDAIDIAYARELGGRIKLIASAERIGARVLIRCAPQMVPLHHALANLAGPLNAVVVHSRQRGRLSFIGAGAGGEATAAAVAADLWDLAHDQRRLPFGVPAASLANIAPALDTGQLRGYYMRVYLQDRPGAIARLSETLAEAGLSIDSLLQKHVQQAKAVPVVLTTHPAAEDAVLACAQRLQDTDVVVGAPLVLPIAE